MVLKWFSKSKEENDSSQKYGAPFATEKPTSGNWQYINGQIYLNGKTISEVLREGSYQPASFFSKLSSDLRQFQDYILVRRTKKNWWKSKKEKRMALSDIDDGGDIGKLVALVDAYQGKISRIMLTKYNDASTGLSLTLDEDGYLILNGMNVDNFIETAKSNPNEKSKLFLKGMKDRLQQVLSQKAHSPNYHRLAGRVNELVLEIDEVINNMKLY